MCVYVCVYIHTLTRVRSERWALAWSRVEHEARVHRVTVLEGEGEARVTVLGNEGEARV